MKKGIVLFLLAGLLSASFCIASNENAIVKSISNKYTSYGDSIDSISVKGTLEMDGAYVLAAYHKMAEEEYIDDFGVALLKKNGNRYTTLDISDDFPTYSASDDAFRKLDALTIGERNFFQFGYTEASGGSGMSNEYDNYLLGEIKGDKIVWLFKGYDRTFDSYFSRWYGGNNAGAWVDGGDSEDIYEYRFLEMGDRYPQILQIVYSRYDDGPLLFSNALLYEYSPEGNANSDSQAYEEVMGNKYIDELAKSSDPLVCLLLGDWALWYNSDVNSAVDYFDKAANSSGDMRIKDGVKKIVGRISNYANDPPEAVALFYNDDFRGVVFQFPDSNVATESRWRSPKFQNYFYIVEEARDHPKWFYAVQNLCYEGAYTDGLSPKDYEKYVKKALKADSIPSDDKAQLAAYFGDWAIKFLDDKLALKYYKLGYELNSTIPFGDYNASRAMLIYENWGETEKALDWAIRGVGYDSYGWFVGDAENLLMSYEIEYYGKVVSLENIPGGDSKRVSSGDMDGDGNLELFFSIYNYNTHKTGPGLIIGRDGDKLKSIYEIPDNNYRSRYIDEGLDNRPCILATTTEEANGYTDTFIDMFGYYDGQYRYLGKFHLTHTNADTTPGNPSPGDFSGTYEVMEGSGGREIRIVEYDYVGNTPVVINVAKTYIFDDNAKIFIEK